MATIANLQGNNPDDKDNVNNTGTPAPTAQPVTIQASATPTVPNQGSGQFTNINKYLNANQNAGQQVGNKIQGGVNRELKGQVNQANTQAQAFQQGVQKAQGNVQQGTTYLGNVGGDINSYNQYLQQQAPTLGPVQANKFNYEQQMGLANDANELTKFSGLRSGSTQAADKTMLDSADQSAQQTAQDANAKLDTRQKQLASETGRYGLLNELVGQKNNYGAGNQRLDQLFLQRDKNNTLGNLNQNLNQQRDTTFKGLLDTAKTLQTSSKAVQEQGTNLTKDLTGQTSKNASGLIEDINSQVGSINDQRVAEIKRYQDFVNNLKTGKASDKELFNKFGLQAGEQTFNVLNQDLTPEQIMNISAQQARDYKDIATQRDVDIYGALAKLGGMDNSALNQAGNLEQAVTLKTGTDSLQGRIDAARQAFLEEAKNAVLTGEGRDTYDNGWGSSGTIRRNASANINDLLNASGYQATTSGSNAASNNNLSQATNLGLNAAATYFAGPAGALVGPAGISSGFTNLIGSIGGYGAESGAARAASIRAQQDLQAKIDSYLQEKGFNNLLSTGGVVDASGFQNQQRANQTSLNAQLAALSAEGLANGLNTTDEELRKASMSEASYNNEMGYAVPAMLDNARYTALKNQLAQAQGLKSSSEQARANFLASLGSNDMSTQVQEEKSPIMSYAEAVAAARARGNV